MNASCAWSAAQGFVLAAAGVEGLLALVLLVALVRGLFRGRGRKVSFQNVRFPEDGS